MSKPFSASQFTATKWDTAEDKAKAANALASFVERGMPERGWRKGIYHTLYQHLFGHIAHYDMYGFFSTWFSTPEQRAEWAEYVANGGMYGRHGVGDPAFTWSDVEVAFAAWMDSSGLIARFIREGNESIEARERAALAALKAKYEEA